MDTIYDLCKIRESVMKDEHQEDTLDLDNFRNGDIDGKRFFEENYLTSGMEQLISTAFERFSGGETNGLIRLKQAMGGGKTHNMLSLALLASQPELRKMIGKDNLFHGVDYPIRVVSFTGRQADVKFGIWGEIAEQVGKFDSFEEFYQPVLSSPGQNAWVELLKDEPVLILLDELPPYMEYLRTRSIGAGTLADVTVNALSNLFNAINKRELSHVCIVVSDLRATYEQGGELLQKAFKNLDNEISRSAMNIEPVRESGDDLYNILKKKLFVSLPGEKAINEVALKYKEVVSQAQQKSQTNINADTIYLGIKEVYPFHPCIKDLFARFKENQNFQQTRGFIRLTRLMVRSLFAGAEPLAKSKYLIHAYDYDLHDDKTYSMIRDIKPKLENAVSHDITNNGRGAAEEMDAGQQTDMQDMAKMLLMASLGDVSGAILGLSERELIGNMAEPGKDIAEYSKILAAYKDRAWYLYTDKDERLFYRDLKNVNAMLVSMEESFTIENAKQEIRKLLEGKFMPKVKDCYQELKVFPSLDEVVLNRDKITLIVFEPSVEANGLHKDLQEFYDQQSYKNRVMFLSGQRNTMENLLELAKRHKGITQIIKRFRDEEHLPESDTQYRQALALMDRVNLQIDAAVKEAFATLYYPTNKGIKSHEIMMDFQANKFDAEEQIRNLLIKVGKFDEETAKDTFRKKIEARIFTSRQMRWQDIIDNAATLPVWNWHHPSALRDACERYVANGYWAKTGDILDKEPPAPKTNVTVRQGLTNEQGQVTLTLIPENGDTIYWEVNQPATTASSKVVHPDSFQTDEMKIYFLCVDSTGKHETGEQACWENMVEVRYNFFDRDDEKWCELEADNPKVKILYTTDGSNVRAGAIYLEPFAIPRGAQILQAIAYYDKANVYGPVLEQRIPSMEIHDNRPDQVKPVEIDKNAPLRLSKKITYSNTKEVYEAIEAYRQNKAGLKHIRIDIKNQYDANNQWVDITSDSYATEWDAEQIYELVEFMRNKLYKGLETSVMMVVQEIDFRTGADFIKWVADRHEELQDYAGSIEQDV